MIEVLRAKYNRTVLNASSIAMGTVKQSNVVLLHFSLRPLEEIIPPSLRVKHMLSNEAAHRSIRALE